MSLLINLMHIKVLISLKIGLTDTKHLNSSCNLMSNLLSSVLQLSLTDELQHMEKYNS